MRGIDIILGIVVIAGAALLLSRVARAPETSPPAFLNALRAGGGINRVGFFVGNARFSVEIADTAMSRAQGLSGRASLGADEGMLFVFTTADRHSFWMRDMNFSLDFVWIRAGRVVGVTENAQPMSATGIIFYKSPEPADQVLEVNAGAVQRFGIMAGDAVYY